jgi:hypothetical protein
MKCKECGKEYNIQETKRLYGNMAWVETICCPQCYTKQVTKPKEKKYLYIISVADGCGYTYSSSYVIKDNNDSIKEICKNIFSENHKYDDYLYMERGDYSIFNITGSNIEYSKEVLERVKLEIDNYEI